MPFTRVLILLLLLSSCVAIILLAWFSGAELYLYLPSRRGVLHRPPTDPRLLLFLLSFSVPLGYWLRQAGVYYFMVMTGGMIAGSIVGYLGFDWTPSIMQHALVVAMAATSIYGWRQKDYFEE